MVPTAPMLYKSLKLNLSFHQKTVVFYNKGRAYFLLVID
ncbi:hypothetical protein M23134_04258 [Microscilla marina ATCC 23134]|uniref:Uncharacterized protein n=1 Tax=Microscilla marina ATCC 23134 TaxID=313606 RepID=A1ZEB7_MICM2|nr:hypothetical protein M23134_04258 [Microscilla marina ATCC 23134]